MYFYDAYKAFEELDEKTLQKDLTKATFQQKATIVKINLPQIMHDSMLALAGYHEEFEQ